ESRAVWKTARDTGKVCQVGLHRRVGPHHVSARKFFTDGNVGEVGMVRCFSLGRGGGAERTTNDTKPRAELDWDMWCGPGPLRPYNSLIQRGWRNFLDYANGQLGDWGVHWLDQVQWFTGVTWPKTVYSSAGRQ